MTENVRSHFVQKHFRKALICLFCKPWPFPVLPHLPSPLGSFVSLGYFSLGSSEPLANVHEMGTDSISQISTLHQVLAPSGSRTVQSRWTTPSSLLVRLVGSLTQDETTDRREVVCGLFCQSTSPFRCHVIKSPSQSTSVVLF